MLSEEFARRILTAAIFEKRSAELFEYLQAAYDLGRANGGGR